MWRRGVASAAAAGGVRRALTPGAGAPPLARSLSSSGSSAEPEERTAQHAWERSCYYNVDWAIAGEEPVYNAIQRMAAFNVGCLMVTQAGKVTGIISERDYVCKVALLGRSSKDTKVVDICTTDTKLVVAKRSDSIEVCVKKMLDSDVRHLPVVEDDSGEVFGLISVKDLVKEFTREKDDILEKLFGTKLQM